VAALPIFAFSSPRAYTPNRGGLALLSVRLRPSRRQALERPSSAAAMLHMRARGLARRIHRERVRSREAADVSRRRSGSKTSQTSAGRSQTNRGTSETSLAL